MPPDVGARGSSSLRQCSAHTGECGGPLKVRCLSLSGQSSADPEEGWLPAHRGGDGVHPGSMTDLEADTGDTFRLPNRHWPDGLRPPGAAQRDAGPLPARGQPWWPLSSYTPFPPLGTTSLVLGFATAAQPGGGGEAPDHRPAWDGTGGFAKVGLVVAILWVIGIGVRMVFALWGAAGRLPSRGLGFRTTSPQGQPGVRCSS